MDNENNNKNTEVEKTQDEELKNASIVEEDDTVTTREEIKENNNEVVPKSNKITSAVLSVIIILLVIFCTYLVIELNNKKQQGQEVKPTPLNSEYKMSGNSLELFDLYFLKLENGKVNKIYSPLSIKYALEMLEEGSSGNSKEQISSVIGDYEARKYVNSENMSFANALFIRDTFENSIKEDYKNILLSKYNAEIILDSFESPDTINSWVKNKTLNLLDNLVDDVSGLDFALVNALAIDMEWNQKFLFGGKNGSAHYAHEKKSGQDYTYTWYSPDDLTASDFENMEDKVSGMKIIASLNNYDIVTELGEENIRSTVETEYRKYIEENPTDTVWDDVAKESRRYSELTEDELDKYINQYLDEYIRALDRNYGDVSYSTDFSLYVDNDVKAFAKDLKEYNGTTLQYIGIMPTSMDLDSYVTNLNVNKVNNIISNLKELKLENFKDGVVTEITGYIPKFKFDYSLDLLNDLKTLGITDIFDSSKANLSRLTSNSGVSIAQVTHKANIEFTQDGIKASAATLIGGLGAAGSFDYLFEVPVEKIDLTFDRPYMFLIRDKATGEVWFVGTVYNPLLWDEDQTKSIG